MAAHTLHVSFFIGLTAVTHSSIGPTLVVYFMDGIDAIVGVMIPLPIMQKSISDHAEFERSDFCGTRIALTS